MWNNTKSCIRKMRKKNSSHDRKKNVKKQYSNRKQVMIEIRQPLKIHRRPNQQNKPKSINLPHNQWLVVEVSSWRSEECQRSGEADCELVHLNWCILILDILAKMQIVITKVIKRQPPRLRFSFAQFENEFRIEKFQIVFYYTFFQGAH